MKTMFNSFILMFIIGILPCEILNGQYLVGKQANEIKTIMNNEYKRFKLNTTDKNTAFKYLKYENKINEITILFFLDENDTCKLVRMMYDYSNINDVLDDLENNHTKIDNNNYECLVDDKKVSVELTEDQWFFTLTVRKKKE